MAQVVYLERAVRLRRENAAATVTPHRRTWRPYTMFYVGLVGLAGALLADPTGSARELCGAWLVPTLGWVAGHYGADYLDREFDAVAKRHRPVSSDWMRPVTGLVGMVVCTSAGGMLAVALNWRTAPLLAAMLVGGVAYNVLFRARGPAENLTRGGLTAFALLFGAMAVRPYPPAALLVVAAVFLLHDTATNLVGALRDVDGDRGSGYRTFPVRHGVTATLTVVTVLCLLWSVLAAVAPWLLGGRAAGRPVFWGMLGAASVLATAAVVMLVRVGRRLSPRQALHAHELLTLERLVLACAFVGLAVGLPVALALLVPAGALNGLLSVSMRSG
ncbi:MAG TPA: UbiA family prenyltransferase [Mycobacteriales bacterium]